MRPPLSLVRQEWSLVLSLQTRGWERRAQRRGRSELHKVPEAFAFLNNVSRADACSSCVEFARVNGAILAHGHYQQSERAPHPNPSVMAQIVACFVGLLTIASADYLLTTSFSDPACTTGSSLYLGGT